MWIADGKVKGSVMLNKWASKCLEIDLFFSVFVRMTIQLSFSFTLTLASTQVGPFKVNEKKKLNILQFDDHS